MSCNMLYRLQFRFNTKEVRNKLNHGYETANAATCKKHQQYRQSLTSDCTVITVLLDTEQFLVMIALYGYLCWLVNQSACLFSINTCLVSYNRKVVRLSYIWQYNSYCGFDAILRFFGSRDLTFLKKFLILTKRLCALCFFQQCDQDQICVTHKKK